MASINYKSNNVDFSKLIKDAMAEGDITNLGYLGRQRESKIASDPTRYANVQPTAGLMGNYAYLLDTNPQMEDYPAAVDASRGKYSTPINYGTPADTPYQPIDYIKQVQDIFNPLKNADLTAIRTAFDNAISGYNAQRPLQEQYKAESLNTVDANYYKALPGLYAAMEAGGQRGGENITGNIALQTTRGQGVNQTNQTYTNNLAAIDEAVRQAQAERASQESEVGLKWDSQIAAAIQAAQQQGIDNARAMAGLTGTFIDPVTGVKTPTLALNQYNTDQADKMKQEYARTINRFGNNYQAEINNVQNDGDPSNDWQIPMLQSARQTKKQNQQAAEAEAAKEKTAAEKARYDKAMAIWKQNGVATAEIAAILGIKEGARTADYDIAKINAATAQKNANTAALNAGKEKSTDSLYNSTYAKAVGWKNSYMPELEVVAGIMATKGLTDSQKQEILDSLYPDPEK